MHLHLVHFFLSTTFASRFNFETFETKSESVNIIKASSPVQDVKTEDDLKDIFE